VTLMLDGRPLPGSMSVAMPGFVGLYQTVFMIPPDTRSGSVSLQMQSGTATSNTVMLLVQ
jgi:uncharacterized protein (TIGR03437 family)